MKTTYIVPIAHDLKYAGRGTRIECGAGTKESCAYAIAEARLRDTSHPIIFLSPCEAPSFGNVRMADVMERYVLERAPDLKDRVKKAVAPFFNTLGELLALRRELIELRDTGRLTEVGRIVFAVKGWHAPRVRILAWLTLSEFRIPMRFRTFKVRASFRERLAELPKTFAQGYLFWYLRFMGIEP